MKIAGVRFKMKAYFNFTGSTSNPRRSNCQDLVIVVSRRGSTPVSTVLRKSVRFFTINIFNNKITIIVWTNVFFFQFPGIRQKPEKGNFRDFKNQKKFPGAPLDAFSLGPSFRKSVNINPRSAPGLTAFIDSM